MILRMNNGDVIFSAEDVEDEVKIVNSYQELVQVLESRGDLP